MKKQIRKQLSVNELISRLTDIQLETSALPPLSDLEKAKLEHSLAIEQLYNSSKVEGTELTSTMINRAIHGRISPSKN